MGNGLRIPALREYPEGVHVLNSFARSAKPTPRIHLLAQQFSLLLFVNLRARPLFKWSRPPLVANSATGSSSAVAHGRRHACWELLSAMREGVSRRSGSVNGTCGVDSQKAVPGIHKSAFPDLFASQSVAAVFPGPAVPHGEIGGGRERPPLFPTRCGRGGVAQFTFAQHLLGGSLPSHHPCGLFL